MHTCLRDEVPSLCILGKRVLFLAKFMQPVNFFFGTFFFFHEKKKGTGGPGVKPPKRRGPGKNSPNRGLGAKPPKRRSPGKAFSEKSPIGKSKNGISRCFCCLKNGISGFIYGLKSGISGFFLCGMWEKLYFCIGLNLKNDA